MRKRASFNGCERTSVLFRGHRRGERTFRPLSSSLRSSTAPAITSHRQSTSAKKPLNTGAAALKANMIGPTGTNASYTLLASSIEQA